MVSRKQNIRNKKIVTLIFVEGDADELIISRLLDHYREKGWCQQGDVKVVNTSGFPSESKMKSKLTQIKQRYGKTQIIFNAVFCEYDTDIFEKGIQALRKKPVAEPTKSSTDGRSRIGNVLI